MKFKLLKAALTSLILFINGFANAGLITGHLSVDNQYSAYLSTSNNIQGNFLSSGNNWGTTYTLSTNLIAGTDYFLHINARDVGAIAGFLGDFSLTGSDHLFSNGLTQILTNTTDWMVSTSGWNNYVNASIVNGTNGVSPWLLRPNIASNATWIWSSNATNDNNVYFSLAITATTTNNVPEPSTLAIFALGMIGLASRRFKKQS